MPSASSIVSRFLLWLGFEGSVYTPKEFRSEGCAFLMIGPRIDFQRVLGPQTRLFFHSTPLPFHALITADCICVCSGLQRQGKRWWVWLGCRVRKRRRRLRPWAISTGRSPAPSQPAPSIHRSAAIIRLTRLCVSIPPHPNTIGRQASSSSEREPLHDPRHKAASAIDRRSPGLL